MVKRIKSPQEKKTLSLTRDCRNVYGENAKASRKNIPRSKARSHRGIRRKANQDIDVIAQLPEELADSVESTLSLPRLQKPKWKKKPDMPLGMVLVRKKERALKRNKK
ncbi:hypothetical protein [Aestuariivirga sp.]|uniref:hypothetical protein n=1 Tax=Aestuariivirga sp. TaxID=2650926 RepID=UPI0039E62F52